MTEELGGDSTWSEVPLPEGATRGGIVERNTSHYLDVPLGPMDLLQHEEVLK